ncbi:MAG: DUF1828 domain-containing protein [Chloroherpetonaceae bacterium]
MDKILEKIKRFYYTDECKTAQGQKALLIHTLHYFEDGDELNVYLTEQAGKIILTDFGFLMGVLINFHCEPEKDEIITVKNIIDGYELQFNNGQYELEVNEDNVLSRLKWMIKSLATIAVYEGYIHKDQ